MWKRYNWEYDIHSMLAILRRKHPIVWYKENTIVTTIRKAAITRKEAVVVVLKILSD